MRALTLTDSFCNSKDLRKEERISCFQVASSFYDMLRDLDERSFLRSDLKFEKEGHRIRFMDILWNVRKVTNAFNKFFDVYAEKIKPNSKQKLRKFMEVGNFTEEELRYLLYSEMVFVFLQNIEEFRSIMLFILKLPINYVIENNGMKKRIRISKKTTIGKLLKYLEEMGIKNSDILNEAIDVELRNGLSHCLFWFHEKGDEECPKPHLHYSEDVEFQRIHFINIADLYLKMRNQSIYTNCLLNVIGDWFS